MKSHPPAPSKQAIDAMAAWKRLCWQKMAKSKLKFRGIGKGHLSLKSYPSVRKMFHPSKTRSLLCMLAACPTEIFPIPLRIFMVLSFLPKLSATWQKLSSQDFRHGRIGHLKRFIPLFSSMHYMLMSKWKDQVRRWPSTWQLHGMRTA